MKIIPEGDGKFRIERTSIGHKMLTRVRIDSIVFDKYRKGPFPNRVEGVFKLEDDLTASERPFTYIPNGVAFPNNEPTAGDDRARLGLAIREVVGRCEIQARSFAIPEFPKLLKSILEISTGIFIGAMLMRGCA